MMHEETHQIQHHRIYICTHQQRHQNLYSYSPITSLEFIYFLINTHHGISHQFNWSSKTHRVSTLIRT